MPTSIPADGRYSRDSAADLTRKYLVCKQPGRWSCGRVAEGGGLRKGRDGSRLITLYLRCYFIGLFVDSSVCVSLLISTNTNRSGGNYGGKKTRRA
jgi:hypothetical protein